MEKPYIKLRQFDLEMYLTSLTVKELLGIYSINVYSPETEEGYQRPPIPPHFRNIGKYLLNENPIMTSAILAAVDNNQILEKSSMEMKLSGQLRIVDGQHRLEGFKYLEKIDAKRFEEVSDFEFPVIIMKINEAQDIHEINTFIDINSKGKKVSTDLAIRLRDKKRKKNMSYIDDDKQVLEAITTSITLALNSASEKNHSAEWKNSIKTSPNDVENIISINAFNSSLLPLVKEYLKVHPVKSYEDIEKSSSDLSLIISKSWELISKKWPESFSGNKSFNKAYNIQKGIGVHALHMILSECYKAANGDSKNTIDSFGKIINESNTTSEDWLIGGKLSGYNSKSGFQIIAKYIKTGILEAS